MKTLNGHTQQLWLQETKVVEAYCRKKTEKGFSTKAAERHIRKVKAGCGSRKFKERFSSRPMGALMIRDFPLIVKGPTLVRSLLH